jgi:hypothetical protein
MKLLFLDLDGVVNTSQTWDQLNSLIPDLCENLAGILHTTGAQLVISSAWRHSGIGPDSQFQKQLLHASPQYYKFIISRLHGKTGEYGTREDQILSYVRIFNPEKFVAVDDNYELFPNIPNWLVLTNHEQGLTIKDAVAVVNKLR